MADSKGRGYVPVESKIHYELKTQALKERISLKALVERLIREGRAAEKAHAEAE